MKETLNQLRQQHQYIVSLLDKPEKVEELITFVDTIHHPLEEQVLFPWIREQAFLTQGGPRCTHFMGLALEFDLLGQINRKLSQFSSHTGFTFKSHSTPEWLTPQNPLSIPIDEHIVGDKLGQSLLYLCKHRDTEMYKTYFDDFYRDYCRLMRVHSDKEDTCLFVMCENNLKT